ncbi:MAG: Fis family transcriptional regulator [Bryobacterales bacterium]|nr:Fis family transcriptional regulator [Bryobacterales bacterium]
MPDRRRLPLGLWSCGVRSWSVRGCDRRSLILRSLWPAYSDLLARPWNGDPHPYRKLELIYGNLPQGRPSLFRPYRNRFEGDQVLIKNQSQGRVSTTLLAVQTGLKYKVRFLLDARSPRGHRGLGQGSGRERWRMDVDPKISSRMARIRSRDTKPEVLLRRALRELGLGYRINLRPVPTLRRTGDIVFLRAKVVVMVDGCFWHGCPQHYRPARRNSVFWDQKIAGNIARDVETSRELLARGWLVVRVWEHEEPRDAARNIADLVASRRAVRATPPSDLV